MKKLIIIVLFFIFFISFINADVISLNSGGDDELIINPHEQIEGFFSGIPTITITPVCGDGDVQGDEECDDGNTDNGDGCSSTCQIEDDDDDDDQGGGGGSGGALITVDPTSFNVNLAINTNIDRTLTITNAGSEFATISISQQDLDMNVILPVTELTLNAGEVKKITITFVGTSKTGIYTGRLIVGGISIPVSLNVRTKLLLFDSNIIVLNENYLVEQGDKLRTQVTLIPMGEKERMDVTLNYVIKDYQGKTYLTKSETLLIDEKIEFKRNFATGALPLGTYIVGLELIYPNGVAPSSAHFEVTERTPISIFGKIIFFLIILIIIILILLIIFLIKRERDKKKQQQGN
ncbi:DUF4215 domain-containing protein [Candidatus Pacearchaeota archaeon]|nr:DUF4215 domain-containing protein [Candidatus Pacearchaeota archaeon]